MSIDIIKSEKSDQKKTAQGLRRRGLSYSEIMREIKVSKSTLSNWLKKVKLSNLQIKKLDERRIEVARKNAKRKKEEVFKMVEDIKIDAAKNIKEISRRELWLIGLMLYYRERNDKTLQKGVNFTSSDPFLIKLFLRWLQEVGGIKKDEIIFDIFAVKHRNTTNIKLAEYWAKVTGFPKNSFNNFYYQKNYFAKNRVRKRMRKTKKSKYGILKVKVKSSSMLARQISGWMAGIEWYITYKYMKKNSS